MYDTFLNLILFGGLPLLFILIFLESTPFFGVFIPGQFLLILVGFLISTTNIYSLHIAIIIVFFAAFLGDVCVYFFARKYGVDGIKRFGVSENSSIYRSSAVFFKKFGDSSIILGRQFNLTRAFMPSLAGILKMHPGRFIFFAFISAILWTLVSIYLGYYFGILIIDKLNFILGFFAFLLIYVIFIYLIYRSFIKLYNENKEVITNYALSNIFYLIFLLLFFMILVMIEGLKIREWFNGYFSFITLFGYERYFEFLLSSYVLSLMFIIILFSILFILKDIKILIIFVQGIFISTIFTLIFDVTFKVWAGVDVYISLVSFSFFIFYLYYIFTHFIDCQKFKKRIEWTLGIFLFFVFIVKCSLTGNFYQVLISYIIAAIECELVLILLHYNILEGYFKIVPAQKRLQ